MLNMRVKVQRWISVMITFTLICSLLSVNLTNQLAYASGDIILDDTDAVYTGAWSSSSFNSGYYGSGYKHVSSGDGSSKARWTPDIAVSGNYKVYYWLPNGYTDRATNVPLTISYRNGSEVHSVNQQAVGGSWVLLGKYFFEQGTGGYVEMTNQANNSVVIADAVKFEYADVQDIVLDDNDAAITGTWDASSFYPNSHEGSYRTTAAGTGSSSVKWTPNILTAGHYNVYYWLPNGFTDRSTNAPYKVLSSEGVTEYSINQQVAGGQWKLLGTHYFEMGTAGYIELTNLANQSWVVADAVKLEYTELVVPIEPPTNLTAVVPSDVMTILSWTDHSSEESGYVLERRVSGGGAWTIFTLPANTTHWIDNRGLSAGTSYDYRIKATNGSEYAELNGVVTKPAMTRSGNVLVNQIGYKPEVVKKVIVKGVTTATSFDVLDAVSGATVQSGVTLSDVVDPISGNVKEGDFTSLSQEGYYRIRTSDNQYSALFTVKENLYEDITMLMLKNVNETRFADSRIATRQDTNQQVQMGKGWEDAWDNRHWSPYGDTIEPIAIGTLLLESDYTWDNQSFTHETAGVSDLAEELKYGLDYLLQIQERNPGGSGWMKYGQIFEAWAPPESGNTINIVNIDSTSDLGGYNKASYHVISQYQYTNALAKGARYFYSIGSNDYADQLKQQAIDSWNYMDTYDEMSHVKNIGGNGEYFGSMPVVNYAAKVLAALELYRLTGDSIYQTKAEMYATKIVNSQDLGFEWNDKGVTGLMYRDDSGSSDWLKSRIWSGLPAYALARAVEAFPQANNWFDWYASLKIYSEGYVKAFTDQTAYDILPYQFGAGPRKLNSTSPVNYSFFIGGSTLSDGNTKTNALNAAAISYSSIVLNDIELENLAHRQLDWNFGANTFATPTMAGVGEVKLTDSRYYSHGANAASWAAMGAMVNGINGNGNLDTPKWSNGWQEGETWGINRSWTELAIATLGQQGRVSGTITSGGVPYANSGITIVNRVTNNTVYTGTTDGDGEFEAVRLNGGGQYTLQAGAYSKDFDLPSGKRLNLSIDLNKDVSITNVSAAKDVSAGSVFAVNIEVKNNGLTSQTFSVELKAQNANGEAIQTITLNAGETGTLSWTLTAGTADRPYVLLAVPESDPEAGRSVMGYIHS
ncbi:MAG: cellulase N-terminal Ig-like domain-containing protein [Candidatus Pristimantibacillus sp.]